MERLRIQSREIYGYYLRSIKATGGCSNRRILMDKTGVEYNKLRNIFEGKGENYYDDGEVVIIRIMTKDFTKGFQSIIRKGKGGMEKFAKYIIKKDSYDN